MLKNKIPLHAFIGINILMLGILGLTIGYNIYIEISGRSTHLSWEDFLGVSIPTVLGTLALFTGLGLLLRMKWSRISINFMLSLLFILFAVGAFFMIAELLYRVNIRALFATSGFLTCSICLVFGIFLFINNVTVVNGIEKVEDKDQESSGDQFDR